LVASEKYPLQAAQRKMLEAVQGKIEEARGSDPWRYEARLSVDQVGTIGEEIGLEELDAVEMFHRLWQEEFFVAAGMDQRATLGLGQHLPFGVIISVERLSTKGLREIGKLPDPGEKLINAFEAAKESIERSDMPEPEKRVVLERARLVIDALRKAEGLADLAGRMFGG
jgi:hypothetical protein